ncbi:uncharacterized protein K452DRAFT_283797 [Aplosporella prunicola CBS 121167]|uniref:Zn(2)-C6 fungal-type domain-containing protein n=1 Tax=Aplosporella prunicola CBS 121167 TaxID=1176127 RepID=A0A6A6BQ73_9PEZI|nr:uncharacterized protein K452DRAFT_283797 [Aplosporella prunicola CBS 121167]KAF2145445.1 hypothetical protein K452DRAFT_283797 [Aplosporella prunicola CBS 121167]
MSDTPSSSRRSRTRPQQKDSSASSQEQQARRQDAQRRDRSPRGGQISDRTGIEPQHQDLIYEGHRQAASQVGHQPHLQYSTSEDVESMEAPMMLRSPFGFPGHTHSFIPASGRQNLATQPQPSAYQSQPRQKSARRNKAHVASACVNCKKAHLSCDVQRPCTRCVASGKETTCYDVQHKKRGRPRLRDTQEARAQPVQDVTGQPSPAAEAPESPASIAQQRDYFQTLRSRRGTGTSTSSQQTASHPSSLPPSPFAESHTIQPPTQDTSSHYVTPMALLNLDLIILKTNAAFNVLFGHGRDFRGMELSELLQQNQTNPLPLLRSDLRKEREDRDPAYLPPIFVPGEQETVQDIEEEDLDIITRGYTDRHLKWQFRSVYGQPQEVTARVRLAKSSNIFFVSVTLPPFPASDIRPQVPSTFVTPIAPRASRPSSRASRTSASAELPSLHPAPYGHSSPLNVSDPPSPYSPYFTFQAMTASLPQPTVSSHMPYHYPQGAPPAEAGFTPVQWSAGPHYQMSARPQSATSEPRDQYLSDQRPRYMRTAQYSPRQRQQSVPEAGLLEVPGRQLQSGGAQQSGQEAPSDDRSKRRRLNIMDIMG